MNQWFLLKRGDTLALMNGAGSTVRVTGGQAWMTQLGDVNDYIIRSDTRRVSSDGSVLIYAFQDCHLELTAPASAQVHLRRRGEIPVAIVRLPVERPLTALRRWFAFAA